MKREQRDIKRNQFNVKFQLERKIINVGRAQREEEKTRRRKLKGKKERKKERKEKKKERWIPTFHVERKNFTLKVLHVTAVGERKRIRDIQVGFSTWCFPPSTLPPSFPFPFATLLLFACYYLTHLFVTFVHIGGTFASSELPDYV